MTNLVQSSHLFKPNRLYISPYSIESIQTAIGDSKREKTGAGIRYYGKLIGFILSAFGVSARIKIDDKKIYVNKTSFAQFFIRAAELEHSRNPSLSWVADQLHNSYCQHKKNGYDKQKVKNIKKELMLALKRKEATDFVALTQRLSQLAA